VLDDPLRREPDRQPHEPALAALAVALAGCALLAYRQLVRVRWTAFWLAAGGPLLLCATADRLKRATPRLTTARSRS
jgi:hypothetical protein